LPVFSPLPPAPEIKTTVVHLNGWQRGTTALDIGSRVRTVCPLRLPGDIPVPPHALGTIVGVVQVHGRACPVVHFDAVFAAAPSSSSSTCTPSRLRTAIPPIRARDIGSPTTALDDRSSNNGSSSTDDDLAWPLALAHAVAARLLPHLVASTTIVQSRLDRDDWASDNRRAAFADILRFTARTPGATLVLEHVDTPAVDTTRAPAAAAAAAAVVDAPATDTTAQRPSPSRKRAQRDCSTAAATTAEPVAVFVDETPKPRVKRRRIIVEEEAEEQDVDGIVEE
jgi:hypothetical protein